MKEVKLISESRIDVRPTYLYVYLCIFIINYSRQCCRKIVNTKLIKYVKRTNAP